MIRRYKAFLTVAFDPLKRPHHFRGNEAKSRSLAALGMTFAAVFGQRLNACRDEPAASYKSLKRNAIP